MKFLKLKDWKVFLTRSVYIVLIHFFSNVFISLFNPTWIQKPNSHVFLNFTGRNLLTGDWWDQVIISYSRPGYFNG